MTTLSRPLALVRDGLLRLADLASPRICASCDTAIGHHGRQMCLACWADLAENIVGSYCGTCGEEVGPHLLVENKCTACREKRRSHIRFDGFVRVGRYEGVLRELILRFKRYFVLDHLLGGLLGEKLAAGFDHQQIHAWIPIPSHWYRRLNRRFQPTELLARQALTRIQRRPDCWLRITRLIEPFHSANRRFSMAQRIDAVRGAFELAPGADVAGKNIALIDDVSTTGATLAEAARTLRRAGAAQICVAVLAKRTHQAAAPVGVDRLSNPG